MDLPPEELQIPLLQPNTDLPPEELQFQTIKAILNESTSLPNPSSRTWHCFNLIIPYQLTVAMFVAVLSRIDASHYINIISSQWTKLLFFQFCCLIFYFVLFPLLSVAYVVTVASLCTASKPVVSFAIPSSVCKRLFIIYLWVSLIMAVYSLVFIGSIALIFVGYGTHNIPLLVFAVVVNISLYLADDASLCRLAGVVSGLEPVYGFAAMGMGRDFLKTSNPTAEWLVFFAFPLLVGLINGVCWNWFRCPLG